MKKIISSIIVIILVLSWAPRYIWAPSVSGEPEIFQSQKADSYNEKIKCLHYDASNFKRSVGSAGAVEPAQGKTMGGIVPHHLLAEKMIASFFKSLSPLDLEILVLIGPNHDRIGDKRLHTAGLSWETPFGILNADVDLTKCLTEKFDAGTGIRLFEQEHSISALIPYVKYYLPNTRIVPILLHGDYGLEGSAELGQFLGEKLFNKSCIIIASVDFSHYLSVEEADAMDEVTLKAITDMDIYALSRMGNDNLDSPPSIITFLSAMDAFGAKDISITGHDNSARIAGSGMDCTTSYFTMLFARNSDG